MNARRGVTLIECLVAIFVAAIGILSILALFPLGAIKMAQAIQADRVSYVTAKASSLAEAQDIRHNSTIYSPTAPSFSDFFISNPANTLPLNGQSSGLVSFTGPGYPLYVDAIGQQGGMSVTSRASATVGTVGTIGGTTSLPRVGVDFVTNVPQALYWFSLLDDLEFQNDGPQSGLVQSTNSGTVNRSNHYSYAYLLRRPRYWDTTVVDLSVVVYNRRPIQAPSIEFVFLPNNGTATTYNTINNANEVILTYTGEKPPVRKGAWILDATVDPLGASVGNQPNIQGFFYRVADVTDLGGSPASVALQLEQPLRGPFPNPITGSQRTFVIMDGVVEVLERASGWKP
jgi:hypothetical protein